MLICCVLVNSISVFFASRGVSLTWDLMEQYLSTLRSLLTVIDNELC